MVFVSRTLPRPSTYTAISCLILLIFTRGHSRAKKKKKGCCLLHFLHGTVYVSVGLQAWVRRKIYIQTFSVYLKWRAFGATGTGSLASACMTAIWVYLTETSKAGEHWQHGNDNETWKPHQSWILRNYVRNRYKTPWNINESWCQWGRVRIKLKMQRTGLLVPQESALQRRYIALIGLVRSPATSRNEHDLQAQEEPVEMSMICADCIKMHILLRRKIRK